MDAHAEKVMLSDEALARQLQAEEESTLADEQLARKLANADLNGDMSTSPFAQNGGSSKGEPQNSYGQDKKVMPPPPPLYAPPPGAPPSQSSQSRMAATTSSGVAHTRRFVSPEVRRAQAAIPHHTNQVIEAGKIRATDEQQMQNWLQTLQFKYGIYNSELEPEHDSDYPCGCEVHQYQRAKWARSGVQDMWNAAVVYPGERAYNANKPYNSTLFSGNPYQYKVVSPYWGTFNGSWGPKQANPRSHAQFITQTISLNNQLNHEAQLAIDKREPKINVWYDENDAMKLPTGADEKVPEKNGIPEKNGDGKAGFTQVSSKDEKGGSSKDPEKKILQEKEAAGSSKLAADKLGAESSTSGTATPDPQAQAPGGKQQSWKLHPPGSQAPPSLNRESSSTKTGKFSSFRKSIGIKTKEERHDAAVEKDVNKGAALRQAIIEEENGRWPNAEWRMIVESYLDKTGMAKKVADVRRRQPIQYLHLLRAGYFEPIPVSWANQASNPLKFSIEAATGWRGITPSWRGYEDTAEERLYWVLNHREGSTGTRLKPDFISALDLARERMSRAVEPPPQYFDDNDTCHLQHTTDGYSKQVLPAPFRAYDRPEAPTDDTMILLDVSGSMDFKPQRPVYNRYLVTSYQNTNQPKNKDLAKAIIRRFVDAMSNHDHASGGYDLTTFANSASYIGTVNHRNLDALWSTVRVGGGTRVMTGWQKVKELHFQKHSESAIHHPVYGWQAGPDTPILRLLLLLDGEATDMDEFELDLLGLSWAHVTIFLIGVDGCPHHHRHANELQRISDVNHHVSFVDAQGNTPERYVTHELLKRHLGYDLSMTEFQEIETPPTYEEAVPGR